MRLFGRHSPEPSPEQLRAAAVDLQRIAAGGIPLGAEQRLKAIAQLSSPFFSSDLTAKEYAISQASGLTPIAQVMGSSIVQHGWQNYAWSTYPGGIAEMPSFAQPWNMARERAFSRLAQEATHAAADAVIGIEASTRGFLGESGNVEYVVFGTAVRETTLAPHGAAPLLSTMSGQDVDKLRRIGAATLGVLGHTAVVCVMLGGMSNAAMGRWGGNREVPEISEGVYEARRLAMGNVRSQAAQLGANGMVISELTHSINHHEYEHDYTDSYGSRTQHYFTVTMQVLGTALHLGAHAPHPAALGTPMVILDLGT